MADPGKRDIDVYQRTTIQEIYSLFNEDNTIFDLTGYSVKAQAIDAGKSYIPSGSFDLDPQITTPETLGEITITKTKTQVDAAGLLIGEGKKPGWDLILTHTTTGVVLPPILQGVLNIKAVNTP